MTHTLYVSYVIQIGDIFHHIIVVQEVFPLVTSEAWLIFMLHIEEESSWRGILIMVELFTTSIATKH